MNKKEIIIIFLILCFICSIQAAFASDSVNGTDDIQATQDIEVVQSTNVSDSSLSNMENQVLSEGDVGTFSQLQTDINNGKLTRNYKFTAGDDDGLVNGILVSHDLTIEGDGNIIIDADKKARIFNIANGATVILKGITFVNAYSDGHGGSIMSNGVVHIDNCKFINSTAYGGNGGSVFLNGAGSTITSSYFEGSNTIKTGQNAVGGAVFLANSRITVSHSTFVNNTAGLNGGAIGSKDGTDGSTIINCTFENNTAMGSAGGIGMQSTNFYMANSTFINNRANGNFETYPGNGGGIVLRGSDSYIYNCTFINNTAKLNGGGTYLTNTTSVSTNKNTGFELCTFIDNVAGYNGGAVNWVSSAHEGYIKDSTFTNNFANRSGGAIYWSGENGTVSNCTFTHNNASGNIHDTIDNIYGGGDGGAILWIGSHGIIKDNCMFRENYAQSRGGAIYLHGSSIENCTNITITHSSFSDNYAGMNGGAVDWNEGSHDGNIFYCNFVDNVAGSNGGAVFWSGHHGEILHSNFTHNHAKGEITDLHGNMGDGGAIIWTGLNGTVDDCRFIDNIASQRGGAAYLQNCSHGNCTNTTFMNSYFKHNTAGTNGGAIDWHEGANDGHVLNSIFEQNIAKRSGGAIYWNGNVGEIKDSNFTANKALGENNATDAFGVVTYGGDGGAVIWIGSEGTVDNCRFIDNEAAKRGGAVYLQGTPKANCTDTTFKNSYFKLNVAGTNGGAIDWNVGAHNGLVDNVEFINNTAKRSGGAIYWNGHNGTIQYSKFHNNSALGKAYGNNLVGVSTLGGDGGAVIWTGAIGTVEYCNFVNNTAAKRGGAIFLQGTEVEPCENTTFKNSYFANNIAGTNGGAIDWYEGAHNGLVENVTFINNTARRSGGAIFWHGVNGTVKNSKFDNNRATGEALQYNIDLSYDDIIVIDDDKLPDTLESGKLYVLNYTNGDLRVFKSYVLDENNEALLLDETEVNSTTISPKDWGLDQFFGGDGGSILWSGDLGLVYNCTFTNSNSARRGGGAYMTGSDYVTYDLCNFTYCTSGTNGGGVDWLAGANYGKIYNCIFNNTRAARSAGAIYYDGWYGEMINITIMNTEAYGGSLKESDDKLVKYAGWDSSHWDTNTTGGDAGAIMFTGNHEYLYNVTFINCTATSRGGAVFLQDNDNVTFDFCNFTNNRALGTANNTYYDRMDESSGFNPARTGHGGAIGFDIGASDGVVKNSYFFNNTAARNGGAISFAAGSFNGTVFNSTFEYNTAHRSGGAFYWEGTNGNISYCNLHTTWL